MDINPTHFSVEWLLCEQTFQHYCLGTDAESVLYWKSWISENPDKSIVFFEAKRLFFILNAQQGNREQQLNELKTGISQFADFKSQFEPQIVAIDQVKPLKKSGLHYTSISLVAASLLMIASLFVYFDYFKNDRIHSLEFSAVGVSRKTVVLEDGSVITLRENSQLIISPNFDKADREVWLKGEAFFNISHNKSKPFVVHAAQNNITVLGTIFNVMAYPKASFTETTLLEGVVNITHNLDKNFSVILKPHQKFVSKTIASQKQIKQPEPTNNKEDMMFVKESLGTETSWVRNKMDIEDESLSEIALKLERFYGVNIQIEDEQVGKYRYSGTFENESLTKTLEALQLSYPFNFKAENNKILIRK